MDSAHANVPAEVVLGKCSHTDLVRGWSGVDVVFSAADGRAWTVPAFMDSNGVCKARFAAPEPGEYGWESRSTENGPGVSKGTLTVDPYQGGNPLYRHGRIGVGESRRYLQHADGTAFFWLADTWWMGLCTRLRWPADYRTLVADRVRKGFSVVQMVAGPLPEFCATTQTWNRQQGNEGGLSWQPEWRGLNPAYYDAADRRIVYLVDQGLVPCIVGMWGYYLPFMGVQKAKEHWRNLIARYAAYPVVWCLAGEARMPTYAFQRNSEQVRKFREIQMDGWTEVARYVKNVDPYHNVLTIHPDANGLEQVHDPSLLDIVMVQTGHGGHHIIPRALSLLNRVLADAPDKPVLNAEPCYEGILGTGWQEVQRFMFWSSICSGACGHTYGAQGIWAMNSRDEPFEVTNCDWGAGYLQDAMHYRGSLQVGLGRRFISQFPFPDFLPLAEPGLTDERPYPFVAGIPGHVRIYYFGADCFDDSLRGMRNLALSVEPGARYDARYFDPRTGVNHGLAPARGDSSGRWRPPPAPSREDWVLLLTRE